MKIPERNFYSWAAMVCPDAHPLRHTQPGVAERFLMDLRKAVEHVKAHPEEKGSVAPVYGHGGKTVPLRGMVSDLFKKYLD